MSIAGNIGHAASDGMRPGEWAGAAFWPLALMLTIEILTRVRWQPGKRWTVARSAALVLVALVAAVLSYRHLAGLMTYWGEDWLNAHLGPLAVDGLMLIAATALLSISKERMHVQEPVASAQDDEIGKVLTLLESAPEEKKPKVQTARNVSPDTAEAAAFQIWHAAPADGKPSVRKLATLAGISPSKAHRLITDWSSQLEMAR